MVRNDGVESWKFPGRKYNVSAIWRIIRPKQRKLAWHRLLWGSYSVPKYAFIAWMAILNRLPTLDRLQAWGLDLVGTMSTGAGD